MFLQRNTLLNIRITFVKCQGNTFVWVPVGWANTIILMKIFTVRLGEYHFKVPFRRVILFLPAGGKNLVTFDVDDIIVANHY